jgi:hypothetical protein
MKEKKATLFDFLNQIKFKTKKYEYDKKIANSYMISMFLSLDGKLIDIVNNINSLQFGLKDDIIYEYYMDKVPKGKRYLKWPKASPKDKQFNKDVEQQMKERGLSKREAMMVVKQMEKIGG